MKRNTKQASHKTDLDIECEETDGHRDYSAYAVGIPSTITPEAKRHAEFVMDRAYPQVRFCISTSGQFEFFGNREWVKQDMRGTLVRFNHIAE